MKIISNLCDYEPARQAQNGEVHIFKAPLGAGGMVFERIAAFHGGHTRKRDNAFMGQVSIGGKLVSAEKQEITLANGEVISVAVVPAPPIEMVRRFTAPWRMSRIARRGYERDLKLNANKKPAQWAKACLWKGEGAEEAGKRLFEFWKRDGSCWSPSWDRARDHAMELIDFPPLPEGDDERSAANVHRV